MEASRFTSFNDMELLENDSFMDYYLEINSSVEEIFGPSFFPENNFEQENNDEQANYLHKIIEEKPKTKNWKKVNDHQALLLSPQEDEKTSKNSIMLSFDNSPNSSENQSGLINDNLHNKVANKKTRVTGSNNLKQQSKKEHILAERRRREKLNQRFVVLSTIIPGLKKIDKATVLGDTYKYVKQLEKEVKTLEEVTKMKTIESAAMLVNQSMISKDDYHHYSSIDGQYPEIEARFSNKDVLIRIHCENKNRVVENLIYEIENLHLLVINSNALVFGSAFLDVTFVAQIVDGFTVTAKDLVKHLHIGLKSLM